MPDFIRMAYEMELEAKFPGFSRYPASIKETMVLAAELVAKCDRILAR